MTQLVYLHLRIHTYAMGWTDAAVRRYVRDAGDLLEQLNELQRCDCTTRNERKARTLARRMDELEARIEALAAQEELQAIKPPLDGKQVMDFLGVAPGPVVGEALAFLLEARLDEGPIEEADAYRAAPRLGRRPRDLSRHTSGAGSGRATPDPVELPRPFGPARSRSSGAARGRRRSAGGSGSSRVSTRNPTRPEQREHVGDAVRVDRGAVGHVVVEVGAFDVRAGERQRAVGLGLGGRRTPATGCGSENANQAPARSTRWTWRSTRPRSASVASDPSANATSTESPRRNARSARSPVRSSMRTSARLGALARREPGLGARVDRDDVGAATRELHRARAVAATELEDALALDVAEQACEYEVVRHGGAP